MTGVAGGDDVPARALSERGGARLRIVVCSDAFLPATREGGPPLSTFNLCRALAAAGADLRVVTTDRDGVGRLELRTDEWVDREGIPVWYARSLPGPYYPAPSAARAVQEVAADCLIGSGTLWTHLGFLAWRTARRRGVPFLLYPRGLLEPWVMALKPIRKRVYWALVGKRIVRGAAAVVALSERERETIAALAPARRVEIIPNGVAIEDASGVPPRSSLAEWLPQLGRRPFLLFLGRIHEVKGLGALLEALVQPVLAGLDFAAVLAGPVDDEYRTRFERLVAGSPARGRIVLAREVSGHHKAALLAHATVFVLPSFSEGLPMAALEALASGCPVIVSPACNLPEITDAGAGLVVVPDPAPLADALALVLTQAERREAMSKRAIELAREKFDWKTIGAQTLALCQELARTSRGDRETSSRGGDRRSSTHLR